MAAAGGDPGRAVVGVERGKEREGGGEGAGVPVHWHDRGYLSRHAAWRDQTGYALQIKINTG